MRFGAVGVVGHVQVHHVRQSTKSVGVTLISLITNYAGPILHHAHH